MSEAGEYESAPLESENSVSRQRLKNSEPNSEDISTTKAFLWKPAVQVVGLRHLYLPVSLIGSGTWWHSGTQQVRFSIVGLFLDFLGRQREQQRF